MVQFNQQLLSILLGGVAISNVEAFVPAQVNLNREISCSNQHRTSTSLNAAPTMVIYWSIKTAIDTIAYGLGATDEVKGTGVWSAFELKRETKEEEDEKKDDE